MRIVNGCPTTIGTLLLLLDSVSIAKYPAKVFSGRAHPV
jgi:hypothetical protein